MDARTGLQTFVWLLLLLVPTAALGQTTLRAVGMAQTGPNDQCGAEIWSLTDIPAGPASHGGFLGVHDDSAGATQPLPIVPSSCDPDYGFLHVRVATRYDAAFGAARGWPAPDARLENLTLRQLPVPAGNDAYAPIPLAGSVPPNPLPPTQTQPSLAISLGRWLTASGDLEITCDPGNTAFVATRMQNLVPNGVYTVWGHWAEPTAEPTRQLIVTPFGGMPNTIVADAEGNAEFCRELAYCPVDSAPDGSLLQFLSVMYMGGTIAFGAVPYEVFAERAFIGLGGLPFLSTVPGGILSFDHLGFRINASGGPDPGPTSPAMCVGPAVTVASFSRGTALLISALLATGAYAMVWRRAQKPAAIQV